MNQRKYLTRSEVNKILCAAAFGKHGTRDACLFRLCFYHGLRVSEACKLQVSDLDLNQRVIYIRRLKNGLSTIQPLTEDVIPFLQAWLQVRNTYRAVKEPWVFLSQKQCALSRQQVYSLLRQYGERAGLAIVPHPHMLRHACGYALADLGVDTRLIQDYLGHRNIRHTVIYTASNAQRFYGVWQK
ncbi:tyrosine-type DNA invertase [Lelliottia sp. V106_10]|uniref:tyrosine-type DNA invertase n=1 Tax=Lelliottia wanjuensis TaxID=3050585 RepID=UPI00254CC694|nr:MULTISPECIES: tyrosine-type DNA invertase [unclassified Lelliottia]MDK9358857.1 tyrosine-type DNA invertase [Lelliottia sp. V106_16]MDK9373544.1 tyrosine-type DNA invertase [Lelliottia sp. V106_10]MDK9600415.1 tyrosine-type DNA invertase [Lelliottia sp. V106_5]